MYNENVVFLYLFIYELKILSSLLVIPIVLKSNRVKKIKKSLI